MLIRILTSPSACSMPHSLWLHLLPFVAWAGCLGHSFVVFEPPYRLSAHISILRSLSTVFIRGHEVHGRIQSWLLFGQDLLAGLGSCRHMNIWHSQLAQLTVIPLLAVQTGYIITWTNCRRLVVCLLLALRFGHFPCSASLSLLWLVRLGRISTRPL